MPPARRKVPLKVPKVALGQSFVADPKKRLRIFEASVERQRLREASRPKPAPATDRGWTREELYCDRGRPR